MAAPITRSANGRGGKSRKKLGIESFWSGVNPGFNWSRSCFFSIWVLVTTWFGHLGSLFGHSAAVGQFLEQLSPLVSLLLGQRFKRENSCVPIV